MNTEIEEGKCLEYAQCTSVIAGVNHDPDCPMFRDYSNATEGYAL